MSKVIDIFSKLEVPPPHSYEGQVESVVIPDIQDIPMDSAQADIRTARLLAKLFASSQPNKQT